MAIWASFFVCFFFFHLLSLDLHLNVAIIKSLLKGLLNDIELRSLTNIKTYKHYCIWIFFSSLNTLLSCLPPLKNKNKSSIKQVRALQNVFFFLVYFCFVIVWTDIEV